MLTLSDEIWRYEILPRMYVKDIRAIRSVSKCNLENVTRNDAHVVPEVISKWEISSFSDIGFVNCLVMSDVSICALESLLECLEDIDRSYATLVSLSLWTKEPNRLHYSDTMKILSVLTAYVNYKVTEQKGLVHYVLKIQLVVYLYKLYIQQCPCSPINCFWFINHVLTWPGDFLKTLVHSRLCPYRYFRLFHDLLYDAKDFDVKRWFMRTKNRDILKNTLDALIALQNLFLYNKKAYTYLVLLELVLVSYYAKNVNNAYLSYLKPRYLFMFVHVEKYFDRLEMCKIMLARTFAELMDV